MACTSLKLDKIQTVPHICIPIRWNKRRLALQPRPIQLIDSSCRRRRRLKKGSKELREPSWVLEGLHLEIWGESRALEWCLMLNIERWWVRTGTLIVVTLNRHNRWWTYPGKVEVNRYFPKLTPLDMQLSTVEIFQLAVVMQRLPNNQWLQTDCWVTDKHS